MTTYKYLTSAALDKALFEDKCFKGHNTNAYMFPKFKVGAYKADGSVSLADATNPLLQKIVGVAVGNILSNNHGLFIQRGVLSEALIGLSVSAGAPIYLGLAPGSLATAPASGSGTAQIIIGYASTNPVTELPTDLRLSIDSSVTVSSGGGGSTVAAQEMTAMNGEALVIAAMKAVAWNNTNQIVRANATNILLSDAVGILLQSTAPGTYGPVQYGGIVVGACDGLSAIAGQPVFLSDVSAGSLTLIAPSDITHSVVRIGYAVPPSGTNGAASDLLLDVNIIFAPT